MATLQDYFNTGENHESVMRPSAWRSQSFTTSIPYTISSVKLLIYRTAFGNDGVVTVSIRATNGSHKPFGANLASGTFTRDTLTTNSGGEWKEIVFGTPYALSIGTQYSIILSSAVGAGDVYWLRVLEAVQYPTGKPSQSSDAGVTWSTPATLWDMMFETWGTLTFPTKASTPTPADADTSVTLDQATLTWIDGGGADTYNVYYGTASGSLSLVSSAQAGKSFTITGIVDGAPYTYQSTRYWRVDSTNGAGTTPGDEWSFTTIAFNPPDPSSWLLVKRLCSCAENKFWFEDI